MMTFFHFANCVALTFVPLYMLFKYSSLSESGSIWRCSLAFGSYIMTQLCKYFVVATLMVPPPASIDCLLDCLGLFYVLSIQQKASLPQVKILSVALGWSFGESLLTRFADLYINAQSPQFDWKHILLAISANLSMVQHICLSSLLWLLSRGSGSTSRIVINSTTKKPAILIGAYVLGLSFIHSVAGSTSITGVLVLSKLLLVSFLAIGTLFTVDLRK